VVGGANPVEAQEVCILMEWNNVILWASLTRNALF
jgi:hypothetical protein